MHNIIARAYTPMTFKAAYTKAKNVYTISREELILKHISNKSRFSG